MKIRFIKSGRTEENPEGIELSRQGHTPYSQRAEMSFYFEFGWRGVFKKLYRFLVHKEGNWGALPDVR